MTDDAFYWWWMTQFSQLFVFASVWTYQIGAVVV